MRRAGRLGAVLLTLVIGAAPALARGFGGSSGGRTAFTALSIACTRCCIASMRPIGVSPRGMTVFV